MAAWGCYTEMVNSDYFNVRAFAFAAMTHPRQGAIGSSVHRRYSSGALRKKRSVKMLSGRPISYSVLLYSTSV